MLYFCFSFHLFGGDKKYTEVGQEDLKHLNAKIKKLASSIQHLNRVLDLIMLDGLNIAASLIGGWLSALAMLSIEMKTVAKTY